MRFLLPLFLLASSALAESFVFSKDGKAIMAGPRDLPSVGVRLDNGQAVLGLHGASDATKAACGWYRVIPDTAKAASNQVVAARSYTLGKESAQETVTFGVRKTITPQQRLEMAFDATLGATEDERVTAFVKAVATCVTGKIDTAVTITVPAKAKAVK